MESIISNVWRPGPEPGLERARLIDHAHAPEGLSAERLRAVGPATVVPDAEVGHIVSVARGLCHLEIEAPKDTLRLDEGSHLYVPGGRKSAFHLEPGCELVHVYAPAPDPWAGTGLLVRHERFLAACAVDGHPLRWVLTPQYLSRRIFLHHDPTLRSKSGHPVSWFRTTMFDVTGLPPNEDGESVFKMSYDSRSEFNICYDVAGKARVRFARHPYTKDGQQWSPWQVLDSDATYHLDEAAGGPLEERVEDPATGRKRTLRNRHEVAADGHVSLFCLFDPAPTGVERHQPGEYSDYEPLDEVVQRPEYARHQRELARFDQMLDRMSLARARGQLDRLEGGEFWQTYLQGQAAQLGLEAALLEEQAGRAQVLRRWMQPG